jgi:hypothetical protein
MAFNVLILVTIHDHPRVSLPAGAQIHQGLVERVDANKTQTGRTCILAFGPMADHSTASQSMTNFFFAYDKSDRARGTFKCQRFNVALGDG